MASEINIISAPDRLQRDSLKFLLLDISMEELMDVKHTFSNFDMDMDFYIYGSYSSDLKWLSKTIEQSDHIIVNNTQLTEHFDLKSELLSNKKAQQVGEKTVTELILEVL